MRFGPDPQAWWCVGVAFVAVAVLSCAREDSKTADGVPGVSADDANVGAAGPAAARPGAAQGARAIGEKASIGVTCTMGDAIEPAVRRAVVDRATALTSALREGRHDALWQALHPQAKRPEDRQVFLDTLQALRARLADTGAAAPAIETVAVGEVRGGINDLARLPCFEGAAEGAPDLSVLVNAGDENVAYVVLLVPGPVFEHAIVLQLRQRQQWHLLGVSVHPSKFRGKNATDWVTVAGPLRREQKLVPAYAALAMAGAMGSRGASVSSPLSAAIEADLQTLRSMPLFIAQTKIWTVGGQDYELHGLSLAATASDVSLVVKYVNRGGLVEEFVGRDADKLMDHVRTAYPELQQVVDAVVFEAYAETPGSGNPVLDAFRVARFF